MRRIASTALALARRPAPSQFAPFTTAAAPSSAATPAVDVSTSDWENATHLTGLVGAPFTTGPRRPLPAATLVRAPRAVTAATVHSLTHVDSTGAARMVNVAAKPVTARVAAAAARVVLGGPAFDAVAANAVKKGDVLAAARLAGVLGAKATPALIPLCHTVPLDGVTVDINLDKSTRSVDITATASATARTGVEMEALAAASAAALTVYDMTKALSKESTIESVRLLSKEGGKSGVWTRGQ